MAGAPAWSQGRGQPDVPPMLQPCPHQLPVWGHLWMCPVMLQEQAPLVHYQKDARKAALVAFTREDPFAGTAPEEFSLCMFGACLPLHVAINMWHPGGQGTASLSEEMERHRVLKCTI